MITKTAEKFWSRVSKDPGLLVRTIKNMTGIRGDIKDTSGGARVANIILSKIHESPELGKKFFRKNVLRDHDALRDLPITDKAKRWSYIKSDDGTYGRMLIPEDSANAVKDAITSQRDAYGVMGELNKLKENATSSLNFVTGGSKDISRSAVANTPSFTVLSGKKVPFYHNTDKRSSTELLDAISNKSGISSPSSIAQSASFSNVPMGKNLFAYPQRNNSLRTSKDSAVVKGEIPLRDVLFGPETTSSRYNSKPMPEMILNEKSLYNAKIFPGSYNK